VKISSCCAAPLHRTFSVHDSGLKWYVICTVCALKCSPVDAPDDSAQSKPDREIAFRRIYEFWLDRPGREGALYQAWRPVGLNGERWSTERLAGAIAELIEERSIERIPGPIGNCLRITLGGLERYGPL